MLLLQIDTLTPITDTASAAASAVSTMPTAEELRFIDLLFKGGWVMIPLVLLAFIALVIFVERYLTIRKASKDEMNLMMQVRQNIKTARLESALALCRNSNTPLGRMLEKGLIRIGRPIKELEKNISILGIIAGIAPMLGFVGTIIGVITIFHEVSVKGIIEIGTISGGLYMKMITSATGLIVGIIAYVLYHILNIMVDRIILKMETDAIEFIDLLEEPGK